MFKNKINRVQQVNRGFPVWGMEPKEVCIVFITRASDDKPQLYTYVKIQDVACIIIGTGHILLIHK